MNKVLIIEDDKIKIEKLSLFFKESIFIIKESYHAGLKELIDNYREYDVVILDMTIPLWEKSNSDLGGNYEQFGGERILREMKRRRIEIPTILVTMFDVFPSMEGNKTFEELNELLLNQFDKFYLGAVFYNAAEDKWKEELEMLINKIDA